MKDRSQWRSLGLYDVDEHFGGIVLEIGGQVTHLLQRGTAVRIDPRFQLERLNHDHSSER